MVNEKKIRIMTDIARDEQKVGIDTVKKGTFYKKDYIAFHTMRIVWSFSLAYVLLCFLIFLYKIEKILLNFVGIDYIKIGVILLLTYFVMIFFCIFFSRLYYTQKYKKDSEIIKEYLSNLEDLKEFYENNRKETMDDTTVDS